MGGSAGGLLMGAIINMEPELYKGIISAVPFVDVVTTMSDETIPLTTFEYKEWGNPANEDEYKYIFESITLYDSSTSVEIKNDGKIFYKYSKALENNWYNNFYRSFYWFVFFCTCPFKGS